MKNNVLIIVCLLLFSIVIGLAVYTNRIKGETNITDTITVEKIDTIFHRDTFTITKPIPEYVEVIKTDTFFTKDGKDTIMLYENKIYQDTLICDKDTAEVQIFISGLKSNVDSMNLNLRKSEIIKTNTITVTKYIEKKKTFWDRIHIQPQITGGYDLANKNWGVMAGVGVGFDL